MLRAFVAVLAFLATGLAIPEDDGVDSALAGDDECVEGADRCGLDALQRRSEKLAVDGGEEEEEEEEVAEDGEEAVGKPEKVPLRVLNNASNAIALANCHERYEVRSGEELRMSTMITGGFWVLPAGASFNCSEGCEDCFYVVMQWTVKDGASVRIGFGNEAETEAAGDGDTMQPQGGGMQVSVSGAGSARCTDASCEEGWTDAIPVDLSSSIIHVVVQGSAHAEEGGNGTADGAADDEELGVARFGRRVFGRRAFRGPVGRRLVYRRPIFRRPIYRPFYRPVIRPVIRPVYPVYRPACFVCYQYGFSTCWWLCR